jgi:hypothetical protein
MSKLIVVFNMPDVYEPRLIDPVELVESILGGDAIPDGFTAEWEGR